MPKDAFAFNRRSTELIAKAVRKIMAADQRRTRAPRLSVQGHAQKIWIGKTDEAIAQFASGTVSKYKRDSAASVPPADETYIVDTMDNIEAFNLFEDLGSGAWCLVVWIGSWFIMPLPAELSLDECSINGVAVADLTPLSAMAALDFLIGVEGGCLVLVPKSACP